MIIQEEITKLEQEQLATQAAIKAPAEELLAMCAASKLYIDTDDGKDMPITVFTNTEGLLFIGSFDYQEDLTVIAPFRLGGTAHPVGIIEGLSPQALIDAGAGILK